MARVAALLAVCASGSSAAYAQNTGQERRSLSIVAPRIESSRSPRIDGELADPAWSEAAIIGDFRQVFPLQGASPTQRTVAYLIYDAEHLYVAIHALDTKPAEIRATVMERDGPIERDDHVQLILDPALTGRDGYSFEINALGSRRDQLIENNSTASPQWDALWSAAATVADDGWVAEMRIPFRSLAYDAASSVWGLQIIRQVGRNGEQIRWAAIDRSRDTTDVSSIGRLADIRVEPTGVGIDAQLFAGLEMDKDWGATENTTDTSFNPSANLFYRVTPSLTSTLTLNPDFSDAPLDERQVNTGRFSLFSPETRDFFLQDAAIFEFGGRELLDDPNGRPFFSRRIGQAEDEIVDLTAGIKLSGLAGPISLGVLSTLTESTPQTDAQALTVARASARVLSHSKAGFIFTHGDPTGQEDNSVYGADFQFRVPAFLGKGVLQVDTFYQRSVSSRLGEDDSYGVSIGYPNDAYSLEAAFKEIGANFAPALGFVNRPGIRDYGFEVARRWRPPSDRVRSWELGAWHDLITDLDANTETRESGLWWGLEASSLDTVWLYAYRQRENVTAAFSLPDEVLVPAGTYEDVRFRWEFFSSQSRWLSADLSVECCEYFGGDYLALTTGVQWRPNAFYYLRLLYEQEEISLDSGDVDVRIGTLESAIAFTPDMRLSAELQYDNISEVLGMLFRYRWEVRPGLELFSAIGHTAIVEDRRFPNRFVSEDSQLIFRIGQTLRF